MSETTNIELSEKCRALGIPLNQICNKDELNMKVRNGCYIINLADSGKEGTHWTCFIVHDEFLIYFDSFGIIYPEIVDEIFEKNKKLKHLLYNQQEIQHISAGYCGQFCIAFLYNITKLIGLDKKALTFDYLNVLLNAFTNIFDVKPKKNK